MPNELVSAVRAFVGGDDEAEQPGGLVPEMRRFVLTPDQQKADVADLFHLEARRREYGGFGPRHAPQWDSLRSLYPDVDLSGHDEEMRKAGQSIRLGDAVEAARREEPDTSEWIANRFPVARLFLSVPESWNKYDAAKAFENGTADALQYKHIARQIVELERAKAMGLGEKVTDALTHAPAFITEWMLAGGAGQWGKTATRNLAERLLAKAGSETLGVAQRVALKGAEVLGEGAARSALTAGVKVPAGALQRASEPGKSLGRATWEAGLADVIENSVFSAGHFPGMGEVAAKSLAGRVAQAVSDTASGLLTAQAAQEGQYQAGLSPEASLIHRGLQGKSVREEALRDILTFGAIEAVSHSLKSFKGVGRNPTPQAQQIIDLSLAKQRERLAELSKLTDAELIKLRNDLAANNAQLAKELDYLKPVSQEPGPLDRPGPQVGVPFGARPEPLTRPASTVELMQRLAREPAGTTPEAAPRSLTDVLRAKPAPPPEAAEFPSADFLKQYAASMGMTQKAARESLAKLPPEAVRQMQAQFEAPPPAPEPQKPASYADPTQPPEPSPAPEGTHPLRAAGWGWDEIRRLEKAVREKGPDSLTGWSEQGRAYGKQYAAQLETEKAGRREEVRLMRLGRSAEANGVNAEADAAELGVPAAHYHDLAAEIRGLHGDVADEQNRMLRDARYALNEFSGAHKLMAAREAKGGKNRYEDWLPGLDQAAEQAVKDYPHLFKPETGENGSHTDQLHAMLREGIQQPMPVAEAYRKAYDELHAYKEARDAVAEARRADALRSGHTAAEVEASLRRGEEAGGGKAPEPKGDAHEPEGPVDLDFSFGHNTAHEALIDQLRSKQKPVQAKPQPDRRLLKGVLKDIPAEEPAQREPHEPEPPLEWNQPTGLRDQFEQHTAKSSLSDRDKQIVGRLLGGQSLAEVASSFGLTRERARQIGQDAVQSFDKNFASMEHFKATIGGTLDVRREQSRHTTPADFKIIPEWERGVLPSGGQGEDAGPPMRRVEKTALANEVTDQQRQKNGLPPILSEARRSNPETWDRAMARLDADPEAGAKLVDELTAKPRATTAEENALLLHRRVTLANEQRREMFEQLRMYKGENKKNYTNEQFAEADRRYEDVTARIDQLDRVIKASGTEWGRAGQFRKQLVTEDYELSSMLAQRTMAKGSELTTAERLEVTKLYERIEALQAKLNAFEAPKAEPTPAPRGEPAPAPDAAPSTAPSGAPTEAPTVAPSLLRQVGGWLRDLFRAKDWPVPRKGWELADRWEKEAVAELSEKLGGRLFSGFDPTMIPALTKYTAAKIIKGGYTLAEFTRAIVERFGEDVKPHVDSIWSQATRYAEEARNPTTPQQTRIDLKQAKQQFTKLLDGDRDRARPPVQRLFGRVGEVYNLSKSIVTSLDFSAALRQGGFTTFSRPLTSLKAMPEALQAFVSKGAAERAADTITQRPNAQSGLYERSGLFLADSGGKPTQQEEAYLSKWAGKIPLVAGSERAYTTFLNRIRVDVFDSMVGALGRKGQVSEGNAKAIANFVNVSTGRGGLGPLERAAVPLSYAIFSPRFIASRFQLLAGQPLYGGSGATRKAIAMEYAKALIGLGVFYGAAKLAGGDDVDIEVDPRSTDFGKLRIGRTRLDPLTGLAQIITLGSRLTTGQVKNSAGVVVPIRGELASERNSPADLITRFVRGKLSPLAAVMADVTVGKDLVGQPVRYAPEHATREDVLGKPSVMTNLTVPFVVRDVYEAMKEQGTPAGAALSLLAWLGMGVQSYGQEESPGRTASAEARELRRRYLVSHGRADSAETRKSSIAELADAAERNDPKAMAQAWANYKARARSMGRNDRQLEKALEESLDHLHPLSGLNKDDQERFFGGLAPAQQKTVHDAAGHAEKLRQKIIDMIPRE